MLSDFFDFLETTPWIPFVPDEQSMNVWSLGELVLTE